MDEFELSSESSWWDVTKAVVADTGGNTLTEALFLNTVADSPHAVLDPELSTGERVMAGVKGAGAVAFDLVGGAVVGKAAGWAIKSRAGQWVAGRVLGSKLGQKATQVLTEDVGALARRLVGGPADEAASAVLPEATVTLRYVEGMSRREFARKAKALQELGDEGLLVRAGNPVARDPAVARAYRQSMSRRIHQQYGATNPQVCTPAH